MAEALYRMAAPDADRLRGLLLLSQDDRREALVRYSAENGTEALAYLFAGFIGLASSVVDNNRESIGLHLTIRGAIDFSEIDRINLPDIRGALSGVIAAEGVTARGRCAGCAFRLGSAANQMDSTIADAEYCLDSQGSQGFLCHEEYDLGQEVTRPCAGFMQASSQRGRRDRLEATSEKGG